MRNLETKLTELIRQQGRLSYLELATECLKGKYGKLQRMYKVDTCSRRLREMLEFGNSKYNKNISLLEENGKIIGWKWNGVIEEKFYQYEVNGEVKIVKESLVAKLLLNYPNARRL